MTPTQRLASMIAIDLERQGIVPVEDKVRVQQSIQTMLERNPGLLREDHHGPKQGDYMRRSLGAQ